MTEEVKLTAADVGVLHLDERSTSIAEQAKELTEQIEALVAKNQELGARIDAIREVRRGIIAQIERAQGQLAMLAVAKTHKSIDAVAPGATVVVSGKELLKALAAKV